MASWPTWNAAIDTLEYNEQVSEDGDVKTPMTGGYVVTRKRFSRSIREFSFSVAGLDATDRSTFRTFVDTYRTTGSFSYTDPDSTAHTVRFKTIPRLTKNKRGIWWAKIELVEV